MSLTFDETYMVAMSARGYHTGDFRAMEHPPFLQYLYGLPVALAGPKYPGDPRVEWRRGMEFHYGRLFFFRSGNDPEHLTFIARVVAVVLAAGLGLTVAAFTHRVVGPWAAVAATAIILFLPDVLGHGGLAYNDLPMALILLGSVWVCDRFVRRPVVTTALWLGMLAGIAVGTKTSGAALAPIGLLLLIAEAYTRRADGDWRKATLRLVPVALATAYATLVALYLGDVTLGRFRADLGVNLLHSRVGHDVPGFLFGETSQEGWWYFFPVVFFLKTPAALHLLLILAAVGAFRSRSAPSGWLASPLRGPVIALTVVGLLLLTANLNIGSRHALVAMPFVAILMGAGLQRVALNGGRLARTGTVALLVAYVGTSLAAYPNFLSYLTELARGRPKHEVLVDSNIDWGQGLLALRDWQRDEKTGPVYLSYFGSALPEGYGIDYLPFPSYFPLEHPHEPANPRYAVVSATNLVGLYLPGNPLSAYRDRRPDRILGGSLYVYSLDR
jgi:hypothetical protein